MYHNLKLAGGVNVGKAVAVLASPCGGRARIEGMDGRDEGRMERCCESTESNKIGHDPMGIAPHLPSLPLVPLLVFPAIAITTSHHSSCLIFYFQL